MRSKLILVLITLSPLALFAGTPFKLKEGLWEVTTTHSGSPIPGMSEDTWAQMPPEQRAQIEAMMKQKGISVNGNTIVVKSCVTREKVEKGMAFAENRGNCTRNIVNSSASHLEVNIHCDQTMKDGNKTTVDGTSVIDLVGSDSVKGVMHMITNSSSHTMNMDSTFTSKYLGPSCGDIK